MMTSISTHEPQIFGSATIYQFPVGGRAGLTATYENGKTRDQALPDSSDYALTDAWYHQEAIRNARQDAKQ